MGEFVFLKTKSCILVCAAAVGGLYYKPCLFDHLASGDLGAPGKAGTAVDSFIIILSHVHTIPLLSGRWAIKTKPTF